MTNEKYKHPKWQRVRLQVLDRDDWKCVACGDENSTLHVHHSFYCGDPWDVPEDSLQSLCESCHSALGEHPKGGVYWAKKKTGESVIGLCWCPACLSVRFYSDGHKYTCTECEWSSSRLKHKKIVLGQSVIVSAAESLQEKLSNVKNCAAGLVTAIEKYLEGDVDDENAFAAVVEKIVRLRRSQQYYEREL